MGGLGVAAKVGASWLAAGMCVMRDRSLGAAGRGVVAVWPLLHALADERGLGPSVFVRGFGRWGSHDSPIQLESAVLVVNVGPVGRLIDSVDRSD